jgi:hypothetical protein
MTVGDGVSPLKGGANVQSECAAIARHTHKWRCRVGLHNWRQWSDPKEITMIKRFSTWSPEPSAEYLAYEQTRKCPDCGRFQSRVQDVN